VSTDAVRQHQVTPLELFFDLVFVFAITQVTNLLANDDVGGVLHGMLVLAVVWWAWVGYAWLTNTVDADEGGVRLARWVPRRQRPRRDLDHRGRRRLGGADRARTGTRLANLGRALRRAARAGDPHRARRVDRRRSGSARPASSSISEL
jgi:hypothetical protein